MPFQPTNFPPLFTGALTGITVTSPFPDSQLIIDRRDAWSVKVDWTIGGFLAPALGGNWEVRAFLESMGVGFEGQVGPTVTVPAAARTATINIPPANLDPAKVNGAYKLVVTLTHVNPAPTGIAGYEEGTIIQFVSEP